MSARKAPRQPKAPTVTLENGCRKIAHSVFDDAFSGMWDLARKSQPDLSVKEFTELYLREMESQLEARESMWRAHS